MYKTDRVRRKDLFQLILSGIFLPSLLVLIIMVLTGGVFNDQFIRFGETIYYPSLGLLTSIVLVIILYYRTRHLNWKTKENLILMSSCLAIFNVLNTLNWEISSFNPPFKRPFGTPSLNFADGILISVILFIFYHLNGLRRKDLSTPLGLLFISFVAPAFLVTLLEGISSDQNAYSQLQFTSGYLIPLVGIAGFGVTFYGIRVSYFTYINSTLTEVRRGAIGLISGFIFLSYALASQVLFVGDTVMIFGFRVRILQLMLFVVGTSLIIYAYARYPIFTYALPFKNYELIIYSASGSPIWTVSFLHSEEDHREGLKASALTAIGELIRDLTGLKGNLQEVIMEDGVLVLSQHNGFAACLISERVSFQQVQIFNEFCKKIFEILTNEPSLQFGQIPNPETTLFPLVSRFFPVKFKQASQL